MRRLLLFLAIFIGVIVLLRRMAGAFRRVVDNGRSPGSPDRFTRRAELVRDKTCNTFVPKDRAIAVRMPDQILYFCSEACRDRRDGNGGLDGEAGAPRYASTTTPS